ncbi:MAG: hypothetical protein ACOYOA_14735, partial [Saprospiraceae bacterium]
MKLKAICLFFSACSFFASAQKHDYIWTLGYGTLYPIYGGTNINFTTSPPDTDYVKRNINFQFNSASICNKSGKLLFYTNGCKIFNQKNKLTKNGSGLNPGTVSNDHCPDGNVMTQGSMFLPHPTDTSLYYLFHLRPEWVNENSLGLIADKIYYSLIDLTGDSGNGEILVKNSIIHEDTLAFGKITAVRHANGRDWWIVVPRMFQNRYIKLLLTDKGIDGPYFQDIGSINEDDNGTGQAVFTPDGTKYIHFDRFNDLRIFNFDRCMGELSNFRRIQLPTVHDSIQIVDRKIPKYTVGGVAVSPNSRFLYVTTQTDVFQYDLSAAKIEETAILIAEVDGFKENGHPTRFFLPHIAPDNKIYINCTNSVSYMHVINNPDEDGLACNLTQHSFRLASLNAFSIPNFPNFRLSTLKGSPCDSLHTIAVKEKGSTLRATLFPNPTSDQVTIKWQNDEGVDCEVMVIDAVGRFVQRRE